MVTLTTISYLEKLGHEKGRKKNKKKIYKQTTKNRQYMSLIETTLFQLRSYKHWRRINVDQKMF